jgi:hypothetical protein
MLFTHGEGYIMTFIKVLTRHLNKIHPLHHTLLSTQNNFFRSDMVAHACNSKYWEAEARGF